MTEQMWDKKLGIQTVGRDESHADKYHHPYEPTPYSVLERLAECPYISKDSRVMDYGCGRGRVGFYLAYTAGCSVTGVEFDPKTYEAASVNRSGFKGRGRAEFILGSAEDVIPDGYDTFYFFNPFSIEIFRTVMARITESFYEVPRKIFLFFYYPDDEYIAHIMSLKEVDFLDEIDCRDLFEGNNMRERIMIFTMDPVFYMGE